MLIRKSEQLQAAEMSQLRGVFAQLSPVGTDNNLVNKKDSLFERLWSPFLTKWLCWRPFLNSILSDANHKGIKLSVIAVAASVLSLRSGYWMLGRNPTQSTTSYSCSSHLVTKRELRSHLVFSVKVSNDLELVLYKHYETGTSLSAPQKLHACSI